MRQSFRLLEEGEPRAALAACMAALARDPDSDLLNYNAGVAASRAGDTPGAERQAHTIKGASANVGGECLRAVAFEMEKAAKAGNLEAVMARLPEMERQFARLKQAMEQHFNR